MFQFRAPVAFNMGLTGTALCLLASLAACGGGGGSASKADSGADKTYLRIEAVDDQSDPLTYEWRATAGVIENRNSKETVWAMPAGPGLHFAYVTVSDGRGGKVQYQYAVSSDKIDNPLPAQAAVFNPTPTVNPGDDDAGGTYRLRVFAGGDTDFAATSGPAQTRRVYLPDVQVRLLDQSGSTLIFAGATDMSGELVLPRLANAVNYQLQCSSPQGVAFTECPMSLTGGSQARGTARAVTPPTSRNLRLFGHVALSDGGVCGGQDEFFASQTTATVQLVQSDGTAMTSPVRVNRFGDYALDAAVPLTASLKLKVQCEGHSGTVDVSRPAGGYVANTLLESSYVVPNSRPRLLKMVATGPDGNVRGQTIEPEVGAHSTGLPGAYQFLTYKGLDTKLSACKYYRAFGAAKDCDAQGNMISPITLDDWKRQHHFAPHGAGNVEVSATYINQRDLNLARRMRATQSGPNDVAFVVCNSPGAQTRKQAEIDQVIDTALADEKVVACVAMEYSPTPGRNAGQPFTKFLTFGPDGKLILSVNLDTRGEKYMPGACVACHGGENYLGRFPELGNPSPDLKAKFQPFDVGNYVFSTRPAWTESAQSAAIRQLNDLVLATNPTPATQALIAGWYAANPNVLDKAYVPPAWASYSDPGNGVTQADSARFYREVVGTSCRTCHTSMANAFDWDAGSGSAPFLTSYSGSPHICGGGPDVMVNASMPNALISVDRLQDRLNADPTLAALMKKILGCSQAAPDPVYPKR
jgi:mono/diheme cytochrome c family protein